MKHKIIKYIKNRPDVLVIPFNNDLKSKDMNNDEKILKAEEIVDSKPTIQRLKKEKGIIERTESSKIVLTEDNRQILND